MHLQIPAFSRKVCRRVQTELYKSPQLPAFSRKTVPRFAGIYKFPHFPAKAPSVLCSKTVPCCICCLQAPRAASCPDNRNRILPSSYPQSCCRCPVRYTRLRDVAPAGCFLNPGAFVRFVMLGFTCISSYLTTHGHSALVTLGLESHALATFCSKSLCRLPVLLSFSPEAASSQHLCFNTNSINKHLQNIPPVQPPRSS